MSWFSGSGQVPADNNVYRWSDDPSHYLIERMGTEGAYIKEIGVGSRVIIDGQSGMLIQAKVIKIAAIELKCSVAAIIYFFKVCF